MRRVADKTCGVDAALGGPGQCCREEFGEVFEQILHERRMKSTY